MKYASKAPARGPVRKWIPFVILAMTIVGYFLIPRAPLYRDLDELDEIFPDYYSTEHYNCLGNCHTEESLFGRSRMREDPKLQSILEGGDQRSFPEPDYRFHDDGGISFEVQGLVYDLGSGWYRAQIHQNKIRYEEEDEIFVTMKFSMVSDSIEDMFTQSDKVCAVMTAYRMYDRDGIFRQQADQMMSTLLTPTGLPIEGGIIDFPTSSFGSPLTSPVDIIDARSVKEMEISADRLDADFQFRDRIGPGFPAGYYRFQIYLYLQREEEIVPLLVAPGLWATMKKKAPYDLIRFENIKKEFIFLPLVKIGDPAPPRMIWTLLTNRFSYGTQGIVAREDSAHFAFASRSSFQSSFVLPPAHDGAGPRKYLLEPDFPAFHPTRLGGRSFEAVVLRKEVPFLYPSGELSVTVEEPDGRHIELGTAPFAACGETGGRTGTDRFLFSFRKWGRHRIFMEGWIEDTWGNRHYGGGSYELWVARRLTFSTSVKPGTPFEVGSGYPVKVRIHPLCPAEVKVSLRFFPNSDPDAMQHVENSGRANRFGYFRPSEDAPKMRFEEQGEYVADVFASYRDPEGRLWVGSQRGAGVVAHPDSTLVAHGLKYPDPSNPERYLARFDSLREGGSWYAGKRSIYAMHNDPVLRLFPYPYHSGDVLFIPTNSFFSGEHASTNGILSLLSMEDRAGDLNRKVDLYPYFLRHARRDHGREGPFTRALWKNLDHQWLSRHFLDPQVSKGMLPLFCSTDNGYLAHNFPEHIDVLNYFYSVALRPGFAANSMVSESMIPPPYWMTGPFPSGDQYGDLAQFGDLPQDVYWFAGGVVYRDLKRGINRYAAYSAMGVVTPKGHHATRVVEAGTEPLFEVNGRDHYLFLANAPACGSVYEVGDTVGLGGLVFPFVRARCRIALRHDGGVVKEVTGTANSVGIFGVPDNACRLEKPGVYEVEVGVNYGGRKGDVVGSGDGTYRIYVVDKDSPQRIRVDLPSRGEFSASDGLEVRGRVSEDVREGKILYSLTTPGIVMDEGTLPVVDGRFLFRFNAIDFGVQFTNYNTTNYSSAGPPAKNSPVLSDTVTITLFLEGEDEKGRNIHSVKLLVLRGNRFDLV